MIDDVRTIGTNTVMAIKTATSTTEPTTTILRLT
jgi:hypothetical protein